MKTRYYIVIFAVLAAVCLGLSAVLLKGNEGRFVEVRSEGKLICTLDLQVDQVRTVETALGKNVIEIRDGAVAVTQADCPDGYCMHRGWCRGGPEIVCLPNRLVIRFLEDGGVDAVAG